MHNGRRASDFHHLGRPTDLQRKVNAYDFVQVEDDPLARIFLKALAGGSDLVSPKRHIQEDIFAVSARLHLARGVSRLVDQMHGRCRHRATAGIHQRAADAATGALRASKRRHEAECHHQNCCEYNAAATDRMQLPETCVNLHDLTPCPKEFFENQFFVVAVPLKPYYNPVNLEKAGTRVKQKEFIQRTAAPPPSTPPPPRRLAPPP